VSYQQFDALSQRLMSMLKPVQVKRSLVLAIEENQELMRQRGSAEPFDGILELWFESGPALLRARDNPDYRALMAEMESLQSRFVDFSRSVRFFTDWDD